MNRDATLANIARAHLRLETLEARNSDSLDFSDQAVWSIKAALEAAYRAGMEAAAAQPKPAKRKANSANPGGYQGGDTIMLSSGVFVTIREIRGGNALIAQRGKAPYLVTLSHLAELETGRQRAVV